MSKLKKNQPNETTTISEKKCNVPNFPVSPINDPDPLTLDVNLTQKSPKLKLRNGKEVVPLNFKSANVFKIQMPQNLLDMTSKDKESPSNPTTSSIGQFCYKI